MEGSFVGGQDDGSPSRMLPTWKASQAEVATDACVVTTATHADRLVMSV